MTVQVKWYRRLLQIRLATLLVACTLTTGLLAWVAAERRESRRQLEVARRVQAALEADRGQDSSIGLTYSGPFDQPDVREQSWWRRVARAWLGTRVVEVYLNTDGGLVSPF
ncbi:MAG: hypothetical protein U0795_01505 [Pirellulales bacterium]